MVARWRDRPWCKQKQRESFSQPIHEEGSLSTVGHLNFICPPIYKHTRSPFPRFSPYSISVHANKLLLSKVSDPHLSIYPKLEVSATPSPSSNIICDSWETTKAKVERRSCGIDTSWLTITGITLIGEFCQNFPQARECGNPSKDAQLLPEAYKEIT